MKLQILACSFSCCLLLAGLRPSGVLAESFAQPIVNADGIRLNSRQNLSSNRQRHQATHPPTVALISPTADTTYAAPATITLEADASDADGSIRHVKFYRGTAKLLGKMIGAVSDPPYRIDWADVPAGRYLLRARAIDNRGGSTISAPVSVTVTAESPSRLYFIHVDHLNTPRLVANQQGQTVWRWDQAEPFGNNVPDENPSGLGAFDLPLRLPGQYFDKETNLHYNYFREYDPSLGIFRQSDPIGLRAGLNTYAYVMSNPLSYLDPFGLDVNVCYYYEAAGGFGHIGFGVGSEAGTQGYYPTGNPFGSPGVIKEDVQKTKECKVIPANPDEDKCMLDCRARRNADPGTYVLTSNQCTRFVRECLKICGLPAGDYFGSAPRPQFLGLPGRSQ